LAGINQHLLADLRRSGECDLGHIVMQRKQRAGGSPKPLTTLNTPGGPPASTNN
jgi:hypothetical protein